jgi:hypothetical protein
VTEDEEHEASKVELDSLMIAKVVQQISGEDGEAVAPSTSIKRP